MQFKISAKENQLNIFYCSWSDQLRIFKQNNSSNPTELNQRKGFRVPHSECDSVVYSVSDIHIGICNTCSCVPHQRTTKLRLPGMVSAWQGHTIDNGHRVNLRHWDEKIFCFLSWEPAEVWHLSQSCVYVLTASQARFARWECGLR